MKMPGLHDIAGSLSGAFRVVQNGGRMHTVNTAIYRRAGAVLAIRYASGGFGVVLRAACAGSHAERFAAKLRADILAQIQKRLLCVKQAATALTAEFPFCKVRVTHPHIAAGVGLAFAS